MKYQEASAVCRTKLIAIMIKLTLKTLSEGVVGGRAKEIRMQLMDKQRMGAATANVGEIHLPRNEAYMVTSLLCDHSDE